MNEAKDNFDPRLNLKNYNKEERVAKFFDNIRKCAPDAVALLKFPVDQENDYPPPITEIAPEVLKQDMSEQSMLKDFMAKLSFKESQLSELGKVTRGQDDRQITYYWKSREEGELLHLTSMRSA